MKRIANIISARLLTPHPRITNREEIHHARLLALILLVLIGLVSVIVALIASADPRDIQEPTVRGALGLLGVCAIMYLLNRAGYTQIAALGLILPVTGVFIYIPFFSGESPIFMAFLLIPVILLALFFSIRWTTVAAAALLGLIYLLVLQQDPSPTNLIYWNMRNLWYFLVLATGLLLTFMWHLGHLENIRREELKFANDQLQRDVVERKLAEEKFRNSEARLRALVENSPDFILEVDRQGEILFINRFRDLYLGKNIRIVLPPDQHTRAFELIENAFRSGQSQTDELQTIAPIGQITWDSVRIGPVKLEEVVTSLTVIITEITAQKTAEARLRESEERYRKAITAAGMVPYVIDYHSKKFTFIGDDIYKLTGYTAAEVTPALLRMSILEEYTWGPNANLSPEEARQRFLAGEILEWHNDMCIRTRTGESRWFSDSSIELRDENGKARGAIGIFGDITERKLAEKEIQQFNAELEQRVAERTAELESANKELEAFSYSVSHDLRAPLRSVVSFAKILNDDFSKEMDPLARGFLQRIVASGKKMNILIDELLDFSRLGRKPLALQMVDLNALMHTVIEYLTPETISRQIEWILAELPPATADPVLLQQVYANLVENAIKYSRQRDPARIEIGHTEREGQTVYFVRDNGAGFDMQYANKLFGVFQRLHRDEEFEGTGIGLATVQRIIHRHGGRIWAEAEVDKGATFYFTLT